MDGIYRDRADGVAARREDLLRRRRDELVTMSPTVRRAVVARSGGVAASFAALLPGLALIAAAVSPPLESALAGLLPGGDPAPMSTLLAAAWIGAALAWALARARAEHRFATIMSRCVLPSDDADGDLERLQHEHPTVVAREMAERLDVAAIAWILVAAAVMVPATTLWFVEMIRHGTWPVAAFDAGCVVHAGALVAMAAAGVPVALVARRLMRRPPQVASDPQVTQARAPARRGPATPTHWATLAAIAAMLAGIVFVAGAPDATRAPEPAASTMADLDAARGQVCEAAAVGHAPVPAPVVAPPPPLPPPPAPPVAVPPAARPPAPSDDDFLDRGERRRVLGGYLVDFDRDGLRVRKGKRKAPLTVRGGRPHAGVEIRETKTTVTLSYMPLCWDVDETFTADQLEARLEYADGKDTSDQAMVLAHFERARALDPAFGPAARDLAVALIAVGRLDEAIEAWPNHDPIGRYVDVALSPSLAPLAPHPAVTAARAAIPGVADLGPTGVGLLPDGSLMMKESLGSHGGCGVNLSWVVRDALTLAPRAWIPLESMADSSGCDAPPSSRAAARRIRERVAVAERLLVELGVQPADGEVATFAMDGARGVRKARFPAADLGLVIGADGAARWFRDGRLLGEHRPGKVVIDDAVMDDPFLVLIPSQHRAIVSDVATSCEWNEEVNVFSIPMPP